MGLFLECSWRLFARSTKNICFPPPLPFFELTIWVFCPEFFFTFVSERKSNSTKRQSNTRGGHNETWGAGVDIHDFFTFSLSNTFLGTLPAPPPTTRHSTRVLVQIGNQLHTLSRVCKGLLWVCRALLGVYMSLLGVYRLRQPTVVPCCEYIGLFWEYVGLFWEYVGLFW